jgi:hypothetical protein
MPPSGDNRLIQLYTCLLHFRAFSFRNLSSHFSLLITDNCLCLLHLSSVCHLLPSATCHLSSVYSLRSLTTDQMGKKKPATKSVTQAPSTPASHVTPVPTDSTCDFHKFLKIARYKDIAQFCNWASTTKEGTNIQLLCKCAIEEGRKLGIEGRVPYNEAYDEGYATRHSDTLQDEFVFEEFCSEGFREGLSIGFENRELAGREAERATREHRTAVCVEASAQTNTTVNTANSSTQTISTAFANAVMQTAFQNEPQ